MKSPLRIAGPDVGPLDFLQSLISHKQQWLGAIQALSRPPEMELLHLSFIKTWSNIRTAFDQKDTRGLKEMQAYLSPWPPVFTLALDPHDSPMVHAAWQTLLEFHTTVRLALEQPDVMSQPAWQNWQISLYENSWDKSFFFPSITSTPGVLRVGSTVAVVTTQPFSFVGAHALQKIQAQNKDATSFRFQSPACCSFDTSYQLASEDLFGAHSKREISKLAFWTMVGVQKESDTSAALIWRPRYYGGPPGTSSSWALHDAAAATGQSAAKARTAMLDWMTALSDSLHEQLHSRNDIQWSPAHNDFLQAYARSWHAVTRIGVSHKRTSTQVNELLGYTNSIHKQLERLKTPLAVELGHVLQWTTSKLRQSSAKSPELSLN